MLRRARLEGISSPPAPGSIPPSALPPVEEHRLEVDSLLDPRLRSLKLLFARDRKLGPYAEVLSASVSQRVAETVGRYVRGMHRSHLPSFTELDLELDQSAHNLGVGVVSLTVRPHLTAMKSVRPRACTLMVGLPPSAVSHGAPLTRDYRLGSFGAHPQFDQELDALGDEAFVCDTPELFIWALKHGGGTARLRERLTPGATISLPEGLTLALPIRSPHAFHGFARASGQMGLSSRLLSSPSAGPLAPIPPCDLPGTVPLSVSQVKIADATTLLDLQRGDKGMVFAVRPVL